MMEQSCRNCKYAQWTMTAHEKPRINKNYAGRCTYVVVLEQLPIPAAANVRELSYILNPRQRHAIWAERPHTDCPVWEAKDGERRNLPR
jgi:hypothetical protein